MLDQPRALCGSSFDRECRERHTPHALRGSGSAMTSELEWTGERYIPGEGGEALALEHQHRYAFAADFCLGQRVLDLGCGEGYGSRLLRGREPEFVVSVDISRAAVDNAVADSGNVVGLGAVVDAECLPFRDHAFDLVVCFEVIEHVMRPASLVDEVRRVLNPSGMLLVSTPNKSVYNENQSAPNPFHMSEMELPEFQDLLAARFRHVSVLSQRVVATSLLWPLSEALAPNGVLKSDRTPTFPYIVAVCSNRELPTARWSAFTAWSHESEAREEAARTYIADLEAVIAQLQVANNDAAARERAAAAQLARDGDEIDSLRKIIAELREHPA